MDNITPPAFPADVSAGSARVNALLQGQNKALELAVSGRPLADILDQIVRSAEAECGDRLLASILLVDKDKKHLRHGAAPSLPSAYNSAIDGVAIGPEVGSCGTAAFSGREVVVSDIAIDPLWKDFKDLALAHGLRACWSTPIFSLRHELLGTFALYYREPATPGAADREAVALLSRTAGLVIEAHQGQLARAESERAVQESEARFRNLVREATVGIVVLEGEEMRISLVNDAYARLIGRTASGLSGRNLFDIVPEAEEKFRPLLEGVRQSGEPLYLYDQPYTVQSDGGAINGWLNLIYQPYRETDGRIKGVMALCHDVTPQVQARQHAEEAQTTARLAAESAGLGTFDVDMKTGYMLASPRLDAIFDVPPGGDHALHIAAVHPEDQAVRSAAYEAAHIHGELDYEVRITHRDGSLRWVRVKGRVFFDEQHVAQKLVGVAQDITEEKQFADELARQVKERTEELEQFTYVSHHDLQEPLRKIAMFSDMIRSESSAVLSDGARNRLDKIITAARRMSAALRDVLDFASLSKKEAFVDVDLDEVLALVLSDLELAIADRKAVVRADALPHLEALPHQMHQLFYNLLNNALKFAHPDRTPEIVITCAPASAEDLAEIAAGGSEETWYRIEVRDNGIGFESEAAERIFGLFQRLHSKQAYAGTGIGLALCRKVVANHGGSIRALSEGQGATFVLLLPAEQ